MGPFTQFSFDGPFDAALEEDGDLEDKCIEAAGTRYHECEVALKGCSLRTGCTYLRREIQTGGKPRGTDLAKAEGKLTLGDSELELSWKTE